MIEKSHNGYLENEITKMVTTFVITDNDVLKQSNPNICLDTALVLTPVLVLVSDRY